MLSRIKGFLNGKKTILGGVGLIGFGIAGTVFQFMDPTESGKTILEGIIVITVRLGIKKIGVKYDF